MRTVDCARSPYGESTFKRNRPSFAVLMVLGGGGGYVLSGHCSRQQISVKNEGVLIFGGVLIYGVFTVS